MDLKKLSALADEVKPVLADLGHDWEALIPDGSDDHVLLAKIGQTLIGGLVIEGTPVTEKTMAIVMALGLCGYVMGYRKAQAAPIFFVAPENEEEPG